SSDLYTVYRFFDRRARLYLGLGGRGAVGGPQGNKGFQNQDRPASERFDHRGPGIKAGQPGESEVQVAAALKYRLNIGHGKNHIGNRPRDHHHGFWEYQGGPQTDALHPNERIVAQKVYGSLYQAQTDL